jgi:pyridoxal phosphate enzyme (YggS family)
MANHTNTVDAEAIKNRLNDVRRRVEEACHRADRSPSDVTVIGVAKTFPVAAVAEARQAGLLDFGENRVQELEEKAGELPGEYNGGDIRWHFVGHLQRNKVKTAIGHFDLFHALDSPRLAREIDKRAGRIDRVIRAFAQVNISGEESKYGLAAGEVYDYLDSIEQYENLRVEGLMTIPSLVDDPEDVRPEFRRMRELLEQYDDSDNPQVDLQYLSMGMTNDFEVAIEEGATHVRVGRGIFGPRDY